MRLVRIFEQLQAQHGLPQVLRTYNGPEFLGEAFAAWAKAAGMATQYIQPGKPNQDAYVERLNRACPDELLDQYLFASLDDVREATYWWMLEYNEERPHDSLGNRTPAEARQLSEPLLAECRLDGGAYGSSAPGNRAAYQGIGGRTRQVSEIFTLHPLTGWGMQLLER